MNFARLAGLTWCVTLLSLLGSASAQVAIVANRTSDSIEISVRQGQSPPAKYRLERGQLQAVPVRREAELTTADNEERFLLDPDNAYYFTLRDGRRQLLRLDLGLAHRATPDESVPDPETPDPGPPSSAEASTKPAEPLEITVKLLVDEEEPAAEQAWERRLRARIDKASEILERTCGVRLRVVAIDRWESDNTLVDLNDALREFEQEVAARPAHIALGFTGQFQTDGQRTIHLGGTRGALRAHLLMREWAASMSEPERLEVLLHELGHCLGAVHSPDPSSVMRAELGDRRARAQGFPIGFDPVNALIMNHFVREIGHGRNQAAFTADATQRIQQLRSLLQREMPAPTDSGVADSRPATPSPSPTQERLATRPDSTLPRGPGMERDSGPAGASAAEPSGDVQTLEGATRHILAVLREPAPVGVRGDELTAYFVGRAATAAQSVPAEHGPRAFVLALGVGLDHSSTLQEFPLTASLCRDLESESERAARIACIGGATIKGRRDWAQHFFISAMLTAHLGKESAALAGLMKEILDSRPGGSGFSEEDLAADQAGVEFAEQILQRRQAVLGLVTGFDPDVWYPARGAAVGPR